MNKGIFCQIENIQRRGVSVSHLDSHKGICFFNPILRAVYRELGKKYTIPLALPKMFIFNSARKSVPGSSDSLIGVYALKNKETLENRLAAYERMLRTLGNGRHYSFSHPAPPTQAIKESLGSKRRFHDGKYNCVKGPNLTGSIDTSGIHECTNW